MSAFLVDDETIHVLVYAATQPHGHCGPLSWSVPDESEIYGYRVERAEYGSQDRADAIGQMLVRQNVASVNFRYDESDVGEIYHYRRPRCTSWAPIEIIKSIHCYQYQACETPDWEQTEAYRFCQALESRMISQLPGYDKAPWGITETSHKQR